MFLASRVLAVRAGVRFDITPPDYFYQLLDLFLLRHDLLRSVFYLHIQPPLFNLFLGIVIQAFPSHYGTVFAILYAATGMTLTISMFLLMKRVGVSARLAFAVTAVFAVSPSCIAYENWLFYSYPLATVLVLSGLAFHAFLRSSRLGHAVQLFLLLAAVVMTRSLFHVSWFAACVALLAVCAPAARKKVLVAAAAPFLLIAALLLKNLFVFGTFGTSTWLGNGLWRMTGIKLSESELEEMVEAGRIHRSSLVPAFSELERYEGTVPMPPETGVFALDWAEKKATGAPNLNHAAYVEISRRYLRDAIRVMVSRPETYLWSLTQSWFMYCQPANDYAFVYVNMKHLTTLQKLYNTLLYGRFVDPDELIIYRVVNTQDVLERRGVLAYYLMLAPTAAYLLLLTVLVVITYGFYAVATSIRRRFRLCAEEATVLFLLFTILFAAFVGNSFEMGDNNRYRFVTDPIMLVVVAVLLEKAKMRVARGLAVGRPAGRDGRPELDE